MPHRLLRKKKPMLLPKKQPMQLKPNLPNNAKANFAGVIVLCDHPALFQPGNKKILANARMI